MSTKWRPLDLDHWSETHPARLPWPQSPTRTVAASPRVRGAKSPPIDRHRLGRTLRLLVASLVCWGVGHEWERQVTVTKRWDGERRGYASTRRIVRRCRRCEATTKEEKRGA